MRQEATEQDEASFGIEQLVFVCMSCGRSFRSSVRWGRCVSCSLRLYHDIPAKRWDVIEESRINWREEGF